MPKFSQNKGFVPLRCEVVTKPTEPGGTVGPDYCSGLNLVFSWDYLGFLSYLVGW